MFDIFVTVLHVALFCGILVFALAVRHASRRRKEVEGCQRGCAGCACQEKRNSVQQGMPSAGPGIILLVLGLMAGGFLTLSTPQASGDPSNVSLPDYKRGMRLWSLPVTGGNIHFYQAPSKPLALIQVSYYAEFVPDAQVTQSDPSSVWPDFRYMEVIPEPGTDAALAIEPFRLEGYWWNQNLIEWRATISMPGEYHIRLVDRKLSIMNHPEIHLSLSPYSYLNFGREFGIFVGGCLFVAVGYVFLTRIISQSSTGSNSTSRALTVPTASH
ncbi:MAG: hypothetical protein LR011_01620 [Verrucomicrobia bacterium]|nr:hypothetical protein [Verrucomicrobiota bacterium]